MAKVDQILEKNSKKLIISDFLDESIKEKDSEGKVIEDYITIKKLSYSVKKKIEFLSFNTLSGKSGKNILIQLKKKGKKLEDVKEMSIEDQMDIFNSMEVSEKDSESMSKLEIEVTKQVIDNGVDPDNHTFTGTDGKSIVVNFDFIEALGSSSLIDFIMREINTFSKGFILGE